MEASTKRGIILAIGLLGWKFTDGALQAWITTIDAVVYILFEILRTDSATKAINAVMEKVKDIKLIIPLMILLLLPMGIAYANPNLCVEPATDAATYELKMDGTLLGEFAPVDWTDGGVLWHCLYDLGSSGRT